MVLLQQLPRSVAVVRIPSSLEGWKDARPMARATTEYVGNDCRGTYEQVHVLRPAGRDWIGMMQAVRMRANMMQGSCDGRGPFPGKIVEIHMGTSRARTGVII